MLRKAYKQQNIHLNTPADWLRAVRLFLFLSGNLPCVVADSPLGFRYRVQLVLLQGTTCPYTGYTDKSANKNSQSAESNSKTAG